jgi:hypothetical protein
MEKRGATGAPLFEVLDSHDARIFLLRFFFAQAHSEKQL